MHGHGTTDRDLQFKLIIGYFKNISTFNKLIDFCAFIGTSPGITFFCQ